MARYNEKTKGVVNTVINHQGGVSIKYDPKVELAGILSTGFDNTYYEKLTDREVRFAELIREIAKTDVEFVAKAMVYARSVMGQRSVTHYGSVLLTPMLSGNTLGKRYFSKRDRKKNYGGIVYRIDDILEIIAAYQALNPNKPLPNSMKRGFKVAIERADAYEIAKYQGKGKKISLVDVFNLIHPKPNANMVEVFKELMNGTLKQFNTVEDKNTKSGQEVAEKVKSGEISKTEAVEVLREAKEDNYMELINEGKIGYPALIRNLRNILNTSKDINFIMKVSEMIVNPKMIKQSLIFPHQIDLALEIILSEVPNSNLRGIIIKALNTAYELAIPNMSEMGLNGRTAVVIDTSGSMTTKIRLSNKNSGSTSAVEKAALIGATFAKGLNADVFEFANICRKVVNVNILDTVNTIKQTILRQNQHGGTSFGSIFTKLEEYGTYDRVFVISDMQGCDDIISKHNGNSYRSYISKHGQPYLYAVDICGYGTTMFKNNQKAFQLFGYTSEMFELASKMEINPKVLIEAINNIVI